MILHLILIITNTEELSRLDLDLNKKSQDNNRKKH